MRQDGWGYVPHPFVFAATRKRLLRLPHPIGHDEAHAWKHWNGSFAHYVGRERVWLDD